MLENSPVPPRRRLFSFTIAQKLGFMVAILSLIIGSLAFISFLGMDVLSAARGYVGGEGLWSKAQKQAVYRLSRYVQSRNELDYQQFVNFLNVPLGDRRARLEMQRPRMDRESVTQGFVKGGIHPDDIPAMIRFFRRFHAISYARDAIAIWTQGDEYIDELLAVGQKMHERVRSPQGRFEDLSDLLADAEQINTRLTPLENAFSERLGTVGRLVNRLLFVSTLVVTLAFLTIGLYVAYSITRQLSRQINRLRQAAMHSAYGEYPTAFNVPAGDEVGDLARAVHTMMQQRSRSEAEILVLNDQLQKHVTELRYANKELEGFSYSVSHDLRAPLRAISGFSRIIIEEHSAQLSDEAKRLLGIIQRNVDHMSVLIDGLLSFSRLGLHPLATARINMQALVTEVVAELRSVEPERPMTITVDPLSTIEGDATLLRHVWINLISNALKFSRKKPETVITIRQRVEGNAVVFSVEDNGAGFDMRYADKLFGVFQRLHSMEEFEGTGIGLALVQRIVARHGGAVWAEGRPGEGATFYFSFPTTKPL